uniref:Uncharacterized protein n=1 Tax=Anguilla anguilla TaxID=7936 RepID=A0A0E9UQC2_ANGAN
MAGSLLFSPLESQYLSHSITHYTVWSGPQQPSSRLESMTHLPRTSKHNSTVHKASQR